MNTSRYTFAILGLAVLVTAGFLAGPAGADRRYAIVLPDDEDGHTAYLGVRLDGAAEDGGGARLTDIVEGSPADEAGLQEDDVVIRFGDETISGPDDLSAAIHGCKPGENVPVTVLRDGRRVKLEVTLGDRCCDLPGPRVWGLGQGRSWNSEQWQEWQKQLQEQMKDLGERRGDIDWQHLYVPGWGRPRLGVQLVDTTPELRRHLGGSEHAGVLVGKVLPGTPAQHADIAVGDLIVSVDGTEVSNVNELVEALSELAGKTFPIRVIRDKRELDVEVTLPEPESVIPDGPRAMLAPAPRAVESLRIAPLPPAARSPEIAPRGPLPPTSVPPPLVAPVVPVAPPAPAPVAERTAV